MNKLRKLDVTPTREISNADRSIYLFDLYKNENEFYYEPALVFSKENEEIDCWDNDTYVKKFLKELKNNDKKAKKELKKHCKERELDYKETKRDLIRIYKAAKLLKFF